MLAPSRWGVRVLLLLSLLGCGHAKPDNPPPPVTAAYPAKSEHRTMNQELPTKCPMCSEPLMARLLVSPHIRVIPPDYLDLMWYLQREADAGRRGAHVHSGEWIAMLPVLPSGEWQYAHCAFCMRCKLVVFRQSGRIPSADVPTVAKGLPTE